MRRIQIGSGAKVILGLAIGLAVILGGVALLSTQKADVESGLINVPGARKELDPATLTFALQVDNNPREPAAGQRVEITATLWSQSQPHARAILRIYVDEELVKEISGALGPFQEAITDYTWRASPGRHTLRVEVSSPSGVIYANDTRTIEIVP